MINLTIQSPEQLSENTELIVQQFGKNKVIVVDGEMGAGKTTLIKELGKQLGVTQVVNSPTFSIVNEYESSDGYPIYHFDCYRINSLREAFDIGIPEYLDSGDYCFIEWAENIAPLLPDQYIKISIRLQENNSRKIKVELIQ